MHVSLSATMHPTIPVHAPLTFTLIDRRNGRSLGQCAYRIDPPEGREYKGRPAMPTRPWRDGSNALK